jgi:hypothetical protein
MAQRSPLSTTLSGISGEYFVAAELSRRGYVASLTLRNTRGIDILVSNADATKSVGIQVKTKQGRGAYWVLNKKVESDVAENLFFVFVTLNALESPHYYVVPRRDVARFVTDSHTKWLKTPGRGGRKHVDNPMRKFKDPDGRYRDKWELLSLELGRLTPGEGKSVKKKTAKGLWAARRSG